MKQINLLSVMVVLAMLMTMTLTAPVQQSAEVIPVNRPQRQAGDHGHHDVVDFGAHTGDHGAFGWYADFPVHSGH